MPSTFSTNLKIELIGLGEQVGTWGTTTNTNLGTALEQAIVGRDMAWIIGMQLWQRMAALDFFER